MAKKRRYPRARRYMKKAYRKSRSASASFKSATKPFVAGLGGYAAGKAVLNLIPMQLPQPVKDYGPYALSYYYGGMKGLIATFVLTAGVQQLGSILGSGVGTGGFVEVT